MNHHKVPGHGAVLAAGVLLGLLLWRVAGHVGGDGFFHLARVQKLLAFDDLSLSSVNESPTGAPPGLRAFPLWHGFLALVAKVSGADPVDVVLHGPTVLAPVAILIGYAAGWAVFRRPVPAAAATAAGVAMVAMAPGAGGALTALALPATASRQPRPGRARARRRGDAQAGAGAPRLGLRGLVRARRGPSHVRALPLDPVRRLRRGALALGATGRRLGRPRSRALVVPAAAYFVWLLPVVADTESVNPDAGERERAFEKYAGSSTARSTTSRSPRAVRPHGRGGRRGAAPHPARGAGRPPPLGRVRRRRLPGGVRDLPRPMAVHAVLRPRLALPVAAAGRVPAAHVRARRRHGRARAARRPARRAARPRGGDRVPDPASGRLRVPRTAGRRG